MFVGQVLTPLRSSLKRALIILAALVLTIPVATADTKLKDVPVGTAPDAVAINPITHKIYIVNEGSNTVSVI